MGSGVELRERWNGKGVKWIERRKEKKGRINGKKVDRNEMESDWASELFRDDELRGRKESLLVRTFGKSELDEKEKGGSTL